MPCERSVRAIFDASSNARSLSASSGVRVAAGTRSPVRCSDRTSPRALRAASRSTKPTRRRSRRPARSTSRSCAAGRDRARLVGRAAARGAAGSTQPSFLRGGHPCGRAADARIRPRRPCTPSFRVIRRELTAVVDPRDAETTRQKLVGPTLKTVPQLRLALAHQFPTSRPAVAEDLIREACLGQCPVRPDFQPAVVDPIPRILRGRRWPTS